jgi:hypothetical protein
MVKMMEWSISSGASQNCARAWPKLDAAPVRCSRGCTCHLAVTFGRNIGSKDAPRHGREKGLDSSGATLP